MDLADRCILMGCTHTDICSEEPKNGEAVEDKTKLPSADAHLDCMASQTSFLASSADNFFFFLLSFQVPVSYLQLRIQVLII